MRRYGPFTNIGCFKINQVSKGASINFGPTIHKGHQANSKFQAAEYIIGDEIAFNFCKNDEENEENGEENNEENECPKFEMNKYIINKFEDEEEDNENNEDEDEEKKKPKKKSCKMDWNEPETNMDHHLKKLKVIAKKKKK
ncbi:spore germination protein [Alkalihalobacterium elongatum]|uniref:spore germination protein n=1 Tax=Alkalihalobacterium elongatum TaxID=2675466 RepID=UPI001C1FDE8D|nr:spore germination protein [Alkalihalobacterium elongatum]